ncbi:hypothetical protein GYMLUDRAFT_79515 [Collybiopsis luxurians FD-317 M1]|nr:hypothetical protein GYMLUDRAFT_79515 [Collybiopsis luxurians FD-317 M1]
MRFNIVFVITAFVSATAFASPVAVQDGGLEVRAKTKNRPGGPVEVQPQIKVQVNVDELTEATKDGIRHIMTLVQGHLQQGDNAHRTFPPLVITKGTSADNVTPVPAPWVGFIVTGLEPECRTRCTGFYFPANPHPRGRVDALDVRQRYLVNLAQGVQNPVQTVTAV